MMNTATRKVLNALMNGDELTAKQIMSRFSVSNPRDIVYNLRQEGYLVTLVERYDSNGRRTQKYSLPTLNRAISTFTVKGIAA